MKRVAQILLIVLVLPVVPAARAHTWDCRIYTEQQIHLNPTPDEIRKLRENMKSKNFWTIHYESMSYTIAGTFIRLLERSILPENKKRKFVYDFIANFGQVSNNYAYLSYETIGLDFFAIARELKLYEYPIWENKLKDLLNELSEGLHPAPVLIERAKNQIKDAIEALRGPEEETTLGEMVSALVTIIVYAESDALRDILVQVGLNGNYQENPRAYAASIALAMERPHENHTNTQVPELNKRFALAHALQNYFNLGH